MRKITLWPQPPPCILEYMIYMLEASASHWVFAGRKFSYLIPASVAFVPNVESCLSDPVLWKFHAIALNAPAISAFGAFSVFGFQLLVEALIYFVCLCI